MRLKYWVTRLYESTVAKILFLASAVIGVIGFSIGLAPHFPAGKTSEIPTHNQLFVGPKVSMQIAESRATKQTHAPQDSQGDQSPNINNVDHDVRIRFDRPATKAQTVKVAPPVTTSRPLHRNPSSQVSKGNQSPNISGVGGNVDIQYGSAEAQSQQPVEKDND